MIFHRIIRVNCGFKLGYTPKRFRKTIPALTVTRQLPAVDEHPSDYLPIADWSEEGQKRYYRQMWYDWIKSLPSVEEKLHEIAVQQRMKLPVYNFSSVPPTYNGVHFQKYITRTHVIRGLPEHLTNLNVDENLNEIRNTFCENILDYYCEKWKRTKTLNDSKRENDAVSKLINKLISDCFRRLYVRNKYIQHSAILRNTRIFSFWWHGGYGTEDNEVHEKNLCFQYEDKAMLSIRMKHPLLPILDMNDPLCTAKVEDYHYHPEVFHIPTDTNALASFPGFWPGEHCEFPFLLVHSLEKLSDLTSRIEKYDMNKILEGFGAMTSFAWLNASATYQGFTPFHDITYPFVTQTILTNGQEWCFFVYQLNTIAFHNDVDKKDRRNILWSSGKLKLFDTVENGQIKGMNDEVLKILLKCLLNTPHLREGVILNPYIGTDNRTTDDILNLRYLLRKKYSRVKELMAHLDEVPTWVKIYKLHPDAPPSPLVKYE